jgi:crotonobetainyl-CoA:carnitine CoA-transferase CaiB-like acyl-CoA transferase
VLNPRIICGSISGFGQDGPYGDRPAVDQVVQGMSGLMSVTGLPGQGPVRAGAAIADVGAGMVLSQGLLMALYQRERTGVGQWVHTSLLESLVAMLDFQVARWLGTGDVPAQAGNDHPTLMPTGVFPTADGQVTLAAAEEPRFKALCEILALPHLLADPRFRSVPLRGRHREALSAELAGRTRRFASEELIAMLNAAGIPCGPIYTIDQAMNDPQMQHLRMAGRVTHPRLGALPLLGQPLHFEGCGGRPPLRAAAPEHGQHTDEILSELLGYGRSDIEALRAQGAVA